MLSLSCGKVPACHTRKQCSCLSCHTGKQTCRMASVWEESRDEWAKIYIRRCESGGSIPESEGRDVYLTDTRQGEESRGRSCGSRDVRGSVETVGRGE